jgi:hypothetical protein
MKTKLIIFALLFMAVLASCTQKDNFKVAISASPKMPEYSKLDVINQKFISKIGRRFKMNLSADRKFLFTTNYKFLLDSSYDMAVISNKNYSKDDTTKKEGSIIKTVLPINSRIFYIAYNKDKITPKSIEDLFEGKNVTIMSNETDFVKKILSDFGVDVSKVNFLKNSMNIGDEDTSKMDSLVRDSISKVDYWNAYKTEKQLPYDVEIGFSTQNFTSASRLHKILNLHNEFILYSLDDYRLFKNGSKAEGFCLRNKYFTPYLLAKGAFGEYPEVPILTFREDFVLAARDDVDEEFVYDFVKTAIEETDLIDMTTYGANLENISIAYPLHEGTKRYLDKNAPTFFEKYGELVGKIGAGVGGFYTAMLGFLLWRKKRRRRNIINDFQKVLDIQARLNIPHTNLELEQMYIDLQSIQQNYHLKMIDHKILVDETLQIFFEMIDKIEGYILKELKRKN